MAEVERAVRASWSAETADRPELWRKENPARCQCGTTAFVIRSLFGGDVVVARIEGTDPQEHHAWNRLESGIEIDLTRCQFADSPELLECEIPEETLVEFFGAQAELLRSRVVDRLAATTPDV